MVGRTSTKMLLLMLAFFSTLYLNSATESEYYVILYGDQANQGFVQLLNGSDSYLLCYDGWDERDAAVVCRMLGYTSDDVAAVLNITTEFTDAMWSYQFDCVGNETSLRSCPIVEVNVTECANQGASGVFCSNNPTLDDFFLLSFGTSIARLDRSSESLTLIQADSTRQIIAIDYDRVEESVIWTDINLNQIAKCNLNGGQKTIIFQSGSASVMDGLAVDSGSRLIFYTDTGYDEIGVINADTGIRTVLVNSFLEEPRKIVFDSYTREIFWTDWGADATIERAKYDGSDREVIVNTGLIWPNSLILDGDIIYWCDANLDKIERIYRNGTGRTEIYTSGLAHCFDFLLLDGYFYCNDWLLPNIVKLSKDRNETSPYGPAGLSRRYGIAHYRKGESLRFIYLHVIPEDFKDKNKDFHCLAVTRYGGLLHVQSASY